jgi:outer membrane protein OmpA-like peptidoglycan-associated protein/tetratricopeptide (TPR) repeat protein
MKKGLQILWAFLLLSSLASWAQNKFSYADKQYNKMRYAHAIEAYEEALKYVKPTYDVYWHLADSYYKVGDTKNAERVFRQYTSDTTLVGLDAKGMLEYAQVLSQNGKYDEAADWFEKYNNKKTLKEDSRGDDFHKAYKHNIHDFYKDSVLFDVFRLDINSPQSDFAPTFYGKGIVFASARKMENGVRRVHSWNNAAFLDLYYIDTSTVNKRVYETHLGHEKENHATYSYLGGNEKLHSDETFRASNDSRTVGYYAHVFKRDTAEHHSTDPTLFDKKLNSKFHDGPCSFNAKQDMVVITRSSPKKSQDGITKMSLFVASKKDSLTWNKPTSFPFNNKEYSIAHPAFSADGKTLYFSSDMPGGYGGMDLFKCSFDGKRWSRPTNLGTQINTEGNEVFPFVDKDNVIYFSSNGHPGLGGLDLFKYEDEKVQHLNYPISSKKDDFGVAVWADGRKGYLSSNRDFGGFDDDLYYFQASKLMILSGTTFDAFTKKVLKNARLVLKDTTGKVIGETVSDSVGNYTMEIEHEKTYNLLASKVRYHDTTAYIATSGTRGQTLQKDIYLWDKRDVALLGLVTDRETNEPLGDVHVKLMDVKTSKNVYDTHTPEGGTFRSVVLEKKYMDTIQFDVQLAKDKYLTKTVRFIAIVDTAGEIQMNQKLDLAMDKVKIGTDIGKVLNLNPIYFDLGSWDIRPDGAVELDKVAAIMLENPSIVIELGSHTDCRSSKKYNQSLSDKRAKASAEYIVSKGIAVNRIYGKGYGESKLINDCGCEGPKKSSCTEEEHQLNRRTEFLIVKM